MKTLKSIGSIVAGIFAIFLLSHVTDLVLEKTGIMKLPFDQNPFWFMILVVAYRCLYVAVGGYLTVALAPSRPMLHALILGTLGTILGILGAVAMWHLPPHWYPISLVILGIPSIWLGARLRMSRNRG